MKNKKIVNLEWYNRIKKLIKEGEDLVGNEKLKIIPEGERDLYKLYFGEDLVYNWNGIEALIFNDNVEETSIKIPKCKLPKGIKEFYEVDEKGNPTGNYDWDYIIRVLGSLVNINESELNIFEMWDSEYADEIQKILNLMPYNVAYLLENINDSSELYEMLAVSAAGKTDLDFPMQLRNNASAMFSLFEECNWDDIDSCWELLSDNLKQDKKFLEKIFKLNAVKESSSTLLKINPELYQDDEEFKMKMLECDCCYLFENLWNETKDLWDSVMKRIDDEEFFRSCEDVDFEYIERGNSEFAEKLFDEIDRRITLAIQKGKKLEYPYFGRKETEKVPLNYLRAMLISRDRKNLGLDVQRYIIGANGGRLKLPKEVAVYNTEIEDEEDDVTIIYGTDKQGLQNILYYYPAPIIDGFTRQQRILNNKGDVVMMKRTSAFDDGRVEDIDDAVVTYTYNREGNKIYSLSEDWIMGTLYNKYDENGEIIKTTEIPKITEQDCNIIATMKKAVGRTIGNMNNAQAEIKRLINNEFELEGEEQDDN